MALTLFPAGLTLQVDSGATILASAHAGGVDIEATCGGRGRCTSCRIKFVSGLIPPPTIMDELQLGEDYYYDGPYLVFTANYHLKRGSCCNSGCRHCPYRSSPETG